MGLLGRAWSRASGANRKTVRCVAKSGIAKSPVLRAAGSIVADVSMRRKKLGHQGKVDKSECSRAHRTILCDRRLSILTEVNLVQIALDGGASQKHRKIGRSGCSRMDIRQLFARICCNQLGLLSLQRGNASLQCNPD
jgi:hypothetical protein